MPRSVLFRRVIPAALVLVLLRPSTLCAQSSPAPTDSHREASYHFLLASLYEERLQNSGARADADHAIAEYKLAIAADPSSHELPLYLAGLEAHSGLLRDAVTHIKQLQKSDPGNLEAHRLLGNIYASLSGSAEGGKVAPEMLRLAIEEYAAIAALGKAEAEDELTLAHLYKLSGDTDAALQAYKVALHLQPGAEETLAQMAELLLAKGDAAGALDLFTNLPDLQRSPRLDAIMAGCYEQLHDYRNAIAALRRIAAADSSNLDARRQLAQDLSLDGQTEEALRVLRVLHEADPRDAETTVRLAELLRHNGDFADALQLLNDAHELVPDSEQVRYTQALTLEALGRYEEAERVLSELLRLEERGSEYTSAAADNAANNNEALFLERLAAVERAQGKLPQAIENYRRLGALGGENFPRASLLAVESYREAREWSKALAAARSAALAAPTDRQLQVNLINQIADGPHPQEALDRLRKLMDAAPSDASLWLTLAQIESHREHPAEAEAALAKALQLSTEPEARSYAQFVAGSIYEHEGKYELAEGCFRQLLVTDPDNAAALNFLGYMLAERGEKLDEAEKDLTIALRQEPQNGAYLDSLGWIYFQMGKLDKAEPLLNRAMERMPLEPELHAHLAELYARTGRLRQAVQQWEKALALWRTGVASESDPAALIRARSALAKARDQLATHRR